MAKKKDKAVIDPVHGAVGQEMTDDDLAELEADTRTGVEGETEPQLEPSGDVEEDLPEGTQEPEDAEPSEPDDGESEEVERLKRLGLFRDGLIESFDDLGKSYKHLERAFSERPKVEAPPQPQVDPQQMLRELEEEYAENPIGVMSKIAGAMNYGSQQQIAELRNQLFYASHPEASQYKGDIDGIMDRYPGLGIQDAFDMYRGQNFEKFTRSATEKAAQTERQRTHQKRAALREQPGGVRTTPVPVEKGLAVAVAGKTGQEAVDAMIKYLEQAGLGAKD